MQAMEARGKAGWQMLYGKLQAQPLEQRLPHVLT